MRKVIVVVGPTAIGKTSLAIEIAKKYHLEIISGDSVSVYKGLDIGSAKPTKEEQSMVKHHMIDVLSPAEQYNVATFQKKARKLMDESDVSLICGGTGLYIQSALFDYEFNARARNESFDLKYESYSNDKLYDYLVSLDKGILNTELHPNNRKRVLRALEITLEGRPFSSYNNKKEALYDYFIIYLDIQSRDLLYKRINTRVDEMIKNGLIDEAKGLYDNNIRINAIGYQELFLYFDGSISLDKAIEDIKLHSRHLAKRQMTWFRNQMDTHVYNVDDTLMKEKVFKDLDNFLEVK